MTAKEQYDKLAAEIEPIKKEVEKAVAKATKDQKDSLAKLWTEVEEYFDTLLAEADAVWKLKILNEAKERALGKKKDLDGDDMMALRAAADVLQEVKNALGWVVPKPVDPAVVAAVVARDRAADMAERAVRGVGVAKG